MILKKFPLCIGLSLLLATSAAWLFRSTAQAGADAIKLVVQDPASGAEFEVTEPALLGFMAFANLSEPLAETPQVSVGFKITRYWDNGPFDRFHYYPGTDRAPGYLFYDGFLQGWSSSDGKWYETYPEADQMMILLLSERGLITASPNLSLPLGIGAGLLIAALTAGGYFLSRGRRAAGQATFSGGDKRLRVK
jgi:hypothetical protein